MGAVASIAVEVAITNMSLGRSGQPRRRSRWRERPHAVYDAHNFRGVRVFDHHRRRRCTAAVRVWRDKVHIKIGAEPVRKFVADPPLGLRNKKKNHFLELTDCGLRWGALHGDSAANVPIVTLLWHMDRRAQIEATIAPVIIAAKTV